VVVDNAGLVDIPPPVCCRATRSEHLIYAEQENTPEASSLCFSWTVEPIVVACVLAIYLWARLTALRLQYTCDGGYITKAMNNDSTSHEVIRTKFVPFPYDSLDVHYMSSCLGRLSLSCDNSNSQCTSRVNINTPSACDYTTSTSSLRLHNLPDARLGALLYLRRKPFHIRASVSANLRPA